MRLRYALRVDELLTVEAAQALVLDRTQALPVEQVALRDALGRVTAEPVAARVDLPPFDSSAMDGYAVRATDLPGRLAIVDSSAAGSPATRPLGAGEAIEISTGGVVPTGADAVIPVEYVVTGGNEISVKTALEPGTNVRPRGGDVAVGATVVESGIRLGAAQLGAVAATGVAAVVCGRRPRVAILATGSELVPPGRALEPGQIYDSNGLMLAAALAAAGADIETLPAVADDESAHREALERGLAADVLVTSGGVSVGPHDLVRRIEAGLGVEEVFWRVAVKPGKPVSFGVRVADGGDGPRTVLVFGLPGNPVSSLVGCELFVKPALRALQGLRDPLPRAETGRLASALRRLDARDEYVRARSRLDQDGVVLEPLRGQDSHMIARAAAADALVHVPRGDGELEAGALVRWLRLGAP
jgi:molybdopterin molybdotransferase